MSRRSEALPFRDHVLAGRQKATADTPELLANGWLPSSSCFCRDDLIPAYGLTAILECSPIEEGHRLSYTKAPVASNQLFWDKFDDFDRLVHWAHMIVTEERDMDLDLSYRPGTREDLAAGKRGAGEVEPGRGAENVEEDGITEEISKDRGENAGNAFDVHDNDHPHDLENRFGSDGLHQMSGDSESGGGPAVNEDLLDDETDPGDGSRWHPDESPAETGERLAKYWRHMKRAVYEHFFDVFEKAVIESSKLGHDFNALLEHTKAGTSAGDGGAPSTKSHAGVTLEELEKRRKETVLALSHSECRHFLMRDHEKLIESSITVLQFEQAVTSKQLEENRDACKDQAKRLENLKHASADMGALIVDEYLGILTSLPPAALGLIIHEAPAQLGTMATEAQQQQAYAKASIYEQGPSSLPDPTVEVAAHRGLEGGTKGEKMPAYHLQTIFLDKSEISIKR